MGVGGEEVVVVGEVVTEGERDGAVGGGALVGEEIGAGEAGGVLRCEDEEVASLLVEVAYGGVGGAREFLLQLGAGVDDARGAEEMVVDGEGGGEWWEDGGEAVGGEVGVGALAGEGLLEVVELGVLVVDADAGREFGAGDFAGSEDGGEARGVERAADDLVPVEAQAGFDGEGVVELPVVLDVGAYVGVLAGEGGLVGEGALAEEGAVLAEVVDGGAEEVLAEGDLVGVDAELEVVLADPAMRARGRG